MAKPSPQPTLTIEIDASLAAHYRTVYSDAFGSDETRDQPLDRFIAGFIEDCLAEELAFAEDELPRRRK